MNGEDEVSGAEEHTEEHTGNVGVVAAAELLFHFHFSFFISTRRVRSAWCRMFESVYHSGGEWAIGISDKKTCGELAFLQRTNRPSVDGRRNGVEKDFSKSVDNEQKT